MQKIQVQSLVQEDPWCCGAAEPKHHNCWLSALEPGNCSFWAHMLQLLKSVCPRAHALKQDKPLQWEAVELQLESSLYLPQLKTVQQWIPRTAKNEYIILKFNQTRF